MTVDKIGVMRGDTLSVKVPKGDVPDDDSFKTVAVSPNRPDATVTLQAGLTRLRIDGHDVDFDGFRYFPTDYEGDRLRAEDADVDFDGLPVEHAATDMTVAGLVRGLRSGSIDVLPKRYTDKE